MMPSVTGGLPISGRWASFRPVPKFNTKSEATQEAKQAFERWLNRDSDDVCAVTKPDRQITASMSRQDAAAYWLARINGDV